jgi:hypothetical protein
LEKKSNAVDKQVVFLGWFFRFWVPPPLLELQKAGCVMFGITGTGLGSTNQSFFLLELEPQIWDLGETETDSPPGGCGTSYKVSIFRHISIKF